MKETGGQGPGTGGRGNKEVLRTWIYKASLIVSFIEGTGTHPQNITGL